MLQCIYFEYCGIVAVTGVAGQQAALQCAVLQCREEAAWPGVGVVQWRGGMVRWDGAVGRCGGSGERRPDPDGRHEWH